MKTNLFAGFGLILTMVSCNQTESVSNTNAETTPETFQEDKYDVSESISRKSSEDLVKKLYEELLEKNKELKKLEEDLNDLPDSVRKSTEAYEKYNSRSYSYYESATNRVGSIQDTILRNRINAIIQKHKSQYEQSTKELTLLNSTIDQNNYKIADQRVVMRVLLTMGMMEQYQKNQKPDKNALLKQIKEQQELLKRMEKAVQ